MARSIRVRVPASTANLGPAFDVAGCALSLYLEVTAQLTPLKAGTTPSIDITAEGEGSADIPKDASNLIVHLLLHRHRGGPLVTNITTYDVNLLPCSMRLHIHNQIPLSRGLGSSASAIVCGIALGNAVGNLGLDKDTLFDYVLELESHPDNVGASMFGGMVVGYIRSEQERQLDHRHRCGYVKLRWNPSIRAIAVVPQFHLSTKKARQVLPSSYSREDAVYNLQRVSVLTAALAQPNPDRYMIHDVLKDRIHQPYRMPLVPGLQQMTEELTPWTTPGLLGVVLSGAGPTILALATSDFDVISSRMQAILGTQRSAEFANGIPSTALLLDIVNEGVQVSCSE